MTPAILLSLSWFWTGHPAQAQVTRQVSHADGWRIEKVTDRFSGEVACRLERGKMQVRDGALVLNLGRRVDATQGRYRIDAGPVMKLDDAALDLAQGHYPFFDKKDTSPIRGAAPLPLSYVATAKTVTVQAKPKLRARTFALDGLPGALDAAKAAGCAIPG
jgi:hypothetical protein